MTLIATVAHELRSPLTSLRLSLDMLVNEFDELEPEHALRLLRRAHRSANYLQGLTENLSSSAAIAADHLQSQTRPIELRQCIDEALALVNGLLEQRSQTASVSSATASSTVLADPARVTQIVANLLSNASRYSIDGDEIEIHISKVGTDALVRVTDHGPGISPEDQQRIFGAWVRADGAQPGGLGLGLSIVQTLTQQQGGRVGVESAVGHGASFWFTLPLASRQEGSSGLSQREWQVAALVARGLSNRQIAEELVVSDRTVDSHVSNILRKLSLTSRAQIAAWVVRRDLAPRARVENVWRLRTVTGTEATANLAD